MSDDKKIMTREFEFNDKTHVVECLRHVDCPMVGYFDVVGVPVKIVKNQVAHRVFDVDLRVNADNMWRIVSDAALNLCDGCKFRQKER